MQPHRKYWVFRNGIDNPKFVGASHVNESDETCTGCHGGVAGTAVRADAHGGTFRAIPAADRCTSCHPALGELAGYSLHVMTTGFEQVLAGRGFDFTDPASVSVARFTKQCAKCHIRNADAEVACGQCHISVPNSAGGGLVRGHNSGKPDMVNQCTACHGSRIKDEYFGSNQAILARNDAVMPAGYTFRGDNTTLQPDVHRSRGLDCQACHFSGEMHGQGALPGIDRYGISGRLQCVDCHGLSFDTSNPMNQFHTQKHVAALACQTCHAQPYKHCYGCHTQEDVETGVGFFSNNGSDPTRVARRVPAAWAATTTYAAGAYVTYNAVEYRSLQASNLNHLPDAAGSTWWTAENAPIPAGDALITFRIGNNPQYGVVPGAPKYGVLRHVPVDGDVFTYTEEGTQVTGLIPNLTAKPTWKFATPHNIQRLTKITTDPDGAGPQTACGNCHSERYASFWLTDAVANSFGWAGIPAAQFDAATTYALGASVTYGGQQYTSLAADNLGHTPGALGSETFWAADPTWEETANQSVVQPRPMWPAIQ